MELVRIRIGNDFILLWQIVRDGMLEDLTLTTSINVRYYSGGCRSPKQIPFELVEQNIVRMEMTTSVLDILGDYRFEISYILPNDSTSDNDQKCRADVKPFTIVALTEEAETIDTLQVCSDLMIGLRGRVYDSKDFTEEEWARIQRPALLAATIAETKGNVAEEKGNTAEAQGNISEAKGNISEAKGNQAKIDGDYARDKGDITKEKGNVAEGQGNISEAKGETTRLQGNVAEGKGNQAKIDGDYAREQGNYAKSEGEFANQATFDANAKVVEIEEQVPLWENRIVTKEGNVDDKIQEIDAQVPIWENRIQSKESDVESKIQEVGNQVPLWEARIVTKEDDVDAKIEEVDVQMPLWEDRIQTKEGAVDTKILEIESEAVIWRQQEAERQADTATAIEYAEGQGDYAKQEASNVESIVAETKGNALTIEEVTAQAIVTMQNRIFALEKIITAGLLDKIQVLNLDTIENFNVWGSTNLILTGNTAPSVIPDFVGQTFINTADRVAYTATGNSSVSDWK